MKLAVLLLLCGVALGQTRHGKPYTMTLDVVSVKAVPFTHGARSGMRTDCRAVGNDISCDTTDSSFKGFQGMSYAILAKSSDGNTYLFGCEAQWRWSHCMGLKTESFHARVDGGSLVVEYHDNKGRIRDGKYAILSMDKTQ
jgi:hypothetical protein